MIGRRYRFCTVGAAALIGVGMSRQRWTLAYLASVTLAAVLGVGLIAVLSGRTQPLALLGWAVFFVSVVVPAAVLAHRSGELEACAEWLRRRLMRRNQVARG